MGSNHQPVNDKHWPWPEEFHRYLLQGTGDRFTASAWHLRFATRLTSAEQAGYQKLTMKPTPTLWLFNIAMGNGTFIEVYLLKMVIFHCYVK